MLLNRFIPTAGLTFLKTIPISQLKFSIFLNDPQTLKKIFTEECATDLLCKPKFHIEKYRVQKRLINGLFATSQSFTFT